MRCPHCGADSDKNIRFCTECGQGLREAPDQGEAAPKAGFSPRINDPAFAAYIKNTRRWAYIFSSVLAIAAVVGFYIYGETSVEMDNPEALYIGFGVGGMFLAIAFLQGIGRRSATWDGVVIDKKIEKKRRKRRSGDDVYWENYILYTVLIKADSGKLHSRSTQNDDTVFNYFRIGDRVRHHGNLNSLEKYDKTGDSIIFCNACASLNDIREDVCFRCHCPLLK